MSETKFTPGPWETDFYNVEDYGVYMVNDSLNQAVCQCFTQYPFAGKPGITDDEAEANARLIAAAPEMYDALFDAANRLCVEPKIRGEYACKSCVVKDSCQVRKWYELLEKVRDGK